MSGPTTVAKREAKKINNARRRAVEDEAIRSLRSANLTVARIAAHLHMDERTVQRRLKALGLTGPAQVPLTDDEVAAAEIALNGGDTYADVSRQLGRSYRAIQKRLPGYELTPQQVGRRAVAIRWGKRAGQSRDGG